MRLLKASLTLLVVFTLAIVAFAQTGTTSVRGTVQDPHKAVIPGATVTLSNPSVNFSRQTTSDGQGAYQFTQVPPGTYNLTADAKGTGKITQKGVRLLVDVPTTVDLMVKLSADTVVEVHGETQTVNTQDATIGNAFNTEQVLNLPFDGRNPVEILSLQPGVAYTGPQGTGPNGVGGNGLNLAGFDSRNGAVSGARSDQSNIVLDGIDNNDTTRGLPFTGALRTTLDATQEFRVTTSNSNSDTGRSSGGQVDLITKSGTNAFHGSLYEYNRTDIGQANNWFIKQSQVLNNEANRPPKLIRNTYGASAGGPLWKDRLFFFGAWEAERSRESAIVTKTVPSLAMRQGFITYCTNSDCSATQTLSPTDITNLDSCTTTCPWGPGPNPNSLATLNLYPSQGLAPSSDPNLSTLNFSAPNPTDLNTYLAKLDYNLTQNGNHKVFVRGNLQDDSALSSPQFPHLPAQNTRVNHSKGIGAGYTALLTNSLVNNFRYGYVWQNFGQVGIQDKQQVQFRGIDDPFYDTQTSAAKTRQNAVPVHSFSDDVSWTKGKHTWQFGSNLRIIHNQTASTVSSFSDASSNTGWLAGGGIAGTGAPLDPPNNGFPAVDPNFAQSYDFAVGALVGLIPEGDIQYNFTKTGQALPQGSVIDRHYLSHEWEMYGQDSWRIKPNLTITAGLRYSILQPPYEIHGNQVAPDVNLDSWFKQRSQAMFAGNTFNQPISFDLSGQANGRKPYWNFDYSNLAPRVAFAYSPNFWHKIFGGEGKTSIRGGWGKYYDHFGEGIVNSFETDGTFGLSTLETNSPGIGVAGSPRYTGPFDIPAADVLPPPPTGFPVTYPTIPGNIVSGLDQGLKTPYSHAFDLSIQRELPGHFIVEAAYVGRLGRRLLQQVDLAMPLDIVDPSSGMDYFTAAGLMRNLVVNNTDINSVTPIPYFEHFFPSAAGQPTLQTAAGFSCAPGASPANYVSATQAMYEVFQCGGVANETQAIQFFDQPGTFEGAVQVSGISGPGGCWPACATINGVQTTGFDYMNGQFSSLTAWKSSGNSSYHAAQLILRRALYNGVQFDFNYTYGKSMDVGSDAERILNRGGPGGQVINSWSPKQLRSVSDFDTTHQINSNFYVELPFGRSRHFGSGMNRAMDAVAGGWNLTGVARWTSGFPIGAYGAFGSWMTNWEYQGYGNIVGDPGPTGHFIGPNGNPYIFKDPVRAADLSQLDGTAGPVFALPLPGQSGSRNSFRGDGYAGLDMGVQKEFRLTESQRIKFAWETYNVFNTVRFDILSSQSQLGAADFGKYTKQLTVPRVMQFSLRYSF